MKKLLIILMSILVLMLGGCGGSGKTVRQDEQQTSGQLEYTAVTKDDISLGSAKRFDFRVVVPSSADKTYLENVAKDIINHEAPFNAAVFAFYDRKEDARGVYTIGKVTWAPYGEWARASEVKTGDYSKHQFVTEVKEKSVAPTKEEFAIHDEIKAILKGPGNPYSENPPDGANIKEWAKKQNLKVAQWEENAYTTVANKYKITLQQAKEIYLKVELR